MDEASSNPIDVSTNATSQGDPPLEVDENEEGTFGTSAVWPHFTRLNWEDKETRKAVCKYCPTKIKCAATYGTSTLKRHLQRCKNYPYSLYNLKKSRTPSAQGTSTAAQGTSSTSPTFTPHTYDSVVSRMKLARMIIIDESPFRQVEREGFRDFVHSLRPEFHIPSRITIAKDCFKLFLAEKEKLKNYFKHSQIRVCLTTDIWASRHHLDYMSLTAHFIDNEWKIQKRIINFSPIPNHTGLTIGKTVEKHLLNWGIDRVLTVTVDNASSNDVGMTYLKKRINNWKGSVLKGIHLHMRCCAHILNLTVKDGLKDVDDSIHRIRSAVRYVRSSNSRMQRFKTCAHEEKLETKKLVCLDVETRWNSTFLMLESALVFKRAFERLEEEDPKYKVELEKLKGTPNELDWHYVESLVPFLKIFYDATMKISGSLYVTSNDLFHVVYGIACMLTKETSSKIESHKIMARRMKAKHDKYWGTFDDINPLLFIAVVLDPRYKLEYVCFVLDEVYGIEHGGIWTKNELFESVNGVLEDMFKDYSEMRGVTSGSSSRSDGSIAPNENDESESVEDYLKKKFKRKRMEDRVEETTLSELERYLKANLEDDEDKTFDILAWWKKHSGEYPILSLMARDVLAIPVSTVASESAFSTGGRVLDTFRSSLTPLVVESLICGQNWLRSSTLPIEMEEQFEEIEELEQELKEFCLDEGTIMSDLVDDD